MKKSLTIILNDYKHHRIILPIAIKRLTKLYYDSGNVHLYSFVAGFLLAVGLIIIYSTVML